MMLEDFYLVCFLVGFTLSALAMLMGHLDLHFHLPHGDIHGFHLHWGNGAHGGVAHGGNGGGHAAHGGNGEAQISPFNFATIAAFLAWFGGSGYLLTRYASFWYMAALGMAVIFGFAGAAMVFWFLGKLVSKDENLDPADYEMVGVLGHVVSGIREGGTGEMVYVQGGTRHTIGARSEDSTAIAKETEVVVTRFEKGIAYVRRWEEMAAEDTAEAKETSNDQ